MSDDLTAEKGRIAEALRTLKPGQTLVVPVSVADYRTARTRAYQILGPGQYTTRRIKDAILIGRL